MRHWLRVLEVGSLIAASALVGCPKGEVETAPPSPVASASSPSASSSSAATSPESVVVPVAPLETIGYAHLPPVIPGPATIANGKALAEHRAKRWAKARTGFEEAVRLAPHYAVARFNLACARARTGDVAGAAALLDALLLEDMPQWAPKLAADPDLESVRSAPEGEKLRARVDALRPRWMDATKGGLPAVLWRGTRAPSGSLLTHFVRPGVYRHDLDRFVPLASTSPKLVAALIDLPGERALLLDADLTTECYVDFCPRVYGYEIRIGALFGEPDPGPKRAVQDDGTRMIWGLGAELVPGGFRMIESTAEGPGWLRFDANGAGRRDPDQKAGRGPSIAFTDSGPLLGRSAGDWHLDGRVLVGPKGARVELDPAHGGADQSTVLTSEDGATVFVLSVRSHCVCDTREGEDFDHVLSRVDVASQKAEKLLREPGSAEIALDAEGALYLQQGTQMRRWPRGQPLASSEPIEEGILLAPPDFGPSNCCGL